MRLNLKSMIVTLVAVALLGTGPVLASPTAEPPGAPDKDHSAGTLARQASILLVEIQKETAELLADIQKETAELRPQPFTLAPFPWDSQYKGKNRSTFLDRAMGHMNAVGERIGNLQQIRHSVLPWQQQAITEVNSHAKRVAASIQATIVDLRENQNRLFVSEYRDHLTTIANHSGDMKHTVDKFLDYEKTPKEAQLLQYEMELVGD
jgi:hypothetical protein